MENRWHQNNNRDYYEKDITDIYRILQEESTENSLDIQEKWELEMNVLISDKDWKLFCWEEHKVTNDMWKEFEWKVKIFQPYTDFMF